MKKIKLEIDGNGYEVAVGRLDTEIYNEAKRLMNEDNMSLNEVFDGGFDYWHEQDNLFHKTNVDFNSSVAKVSSVDTEKVIIEKKIEDWQSEDYEDDDFENYKYENYFNKKEGPILFGFTFWKDMGLEGVINLPDGEEFDESKLIFLFNDVGAQEGPTGSIDILSDVIYNGQKIELEFIASSRSSGLDVFLID